MRNRIMRATVSRTLVDNAEQTATEKQVKIGGTKDSPIMVKLSHLKMQQKVSNCSPAEAKKILLFKHTQSSIKWEFRQLGGQND